MTLTSIHIDSAVIDTYPEVKIGILKAYFSSDPLPISMPSPEKLKIYLENKGIQASTYSQYPDIKVWRELFHNDFGVNPKQYRPSVDALVRRVIRGKGLPSILPLVDVYNICSIQTLLPMGGYDSKKLKGKLILRYGREGERFLPLHEKNIQNVNAKEIVYADDEQVICWLWNYKDTTDTCITKETRSVLYCIDSINTPFATISQCLSELKKSLEDLGGIVETTDVLSKEKRYISL